ncbi:MAG: hypothetical protein KatS3mg097_517 [Candidatus Parcubacteria bacterium]|nr:MAG: hypothetical protein KatS3mg097_517 [Candidatus Parcubacteria bacterium]
MKYIFLLSRLILGFYFLSNAFNHFKNLSILAEYAKSKNVLKPKLAVIFTGFLLLIGGLSILLGVYIEIGVLALTLFFLPVSFIMHNFWKVQDPQMKMIEMVNFTKNMAIWACILLLLFVPQPLSYLEQLKICKDLSEEACFANDNCIGIYGPSYCSPSPLEMCTTDLVFKYCWASGLNAYEIQQIKNECSKIGGKFRKDKISGYECLCEKSGYIGDYGCLEDLIYKLESN